MSVFEHCALFLKGSLKPSVLVSGRVPLDVENAHGEFSFCTFMLEGFV